LNSFFENVEVEVENVEFDGFKRYKVCGLSHKYTVCPEEEI
jgi:hypothetical protein